MPCTYICRGICPIHSWHYIGYVGCFTYIRISHTLILACAHMHTHLHTHTHARFHIHSYCCVEEGVPTARETPGSVLSFYPPPRPPPPLLLPILPFLQACVMSLSPDSRHVNEDVMRLTDMQLIWFPSLPCDDASIKGHAAHKQFRKREAGWLNS